VEALRIEGLSKHFGGVQAVKDVSFTVQAGERLAIIGPNGAGKTTLFNLLNGQEKPTTGRIYFFGQDITTMPTYRRAHLGQGRSFQLTSLFPKLTVLHNVLLAVQGTQPSRFQLFRPITAYKHLFTKAQELLEATALWEKRDEVVEALGYGEQRRLEIALSLASEPKLLLLDEPSTGLTAAESAGIITMIGKLGPDVTAVVVAHDMDLVFGLAERIMVLHYGEIIVDGTPEEIRASSKVKEIYMGIEGEAGNARAN
jgi:branched-chain amino acid transport system ATP-binding protein